MKLVYNDSSHSYWLGGKRVKSASKVAQIAADSFSIEQWRDRMCVIGMTLEPALRERVAVDLENKEAIQKIAEEAKNVAKANTRAQRGTQRHRVFELGLLGCQDQFITEQQIADWKVLARTLDAYGMTPIVDRVEQFIAWPDNGVVGRYDAYLGYQGAPVLVDLKGGENAVKYPHSTAVQLWLYRFAPQTSKVIVRNGDKSEVTEWTTAPDGADADSAYVIYCDDHHDVGELWRIDLNAARSGGELALGIVDWRKSYNYGKELAQPVPAPIAPDGLPAEPEFHVDQEDDYPEDWRLTAKRRYKSWSTDEQLAYTERKHGIDTTDPAAVFALMDDIDRFNVMVPMPPREKDHYVEGDEVIYKGKRYRVGVDNGSSVHLPDLPDHLSTRSAHTKAGQWGYPPLLERWVQKKFVEPAEPHAPEEGGTVDQADVEALQKRFDALGTEAQMWTGMLVAQGNRTHPFRIRDTPTVRRYELYRGILAIAEWVFT